MTHNTVILKDLPNKRLHVTREFNAPVNQVWKAWTDSNLLDKWWAPKPWRAQTKLMDFRAGGQWLYCMADPDGEKHWSHVTIKTVDEPHSFTTACVFCDENGNTDNNFPVINWFVEFIVTGTGTKVEVTISADKEANLQKLIEMGFEGGFTMGLNNLDELLQEL
jgi:uncharacterized protein YndB with AHSA1/START domain